MAQRLYLTYAEVQKIFQSIPAGKNCIRDRCMVIMCFIHGLRASELTGIKINDIDFLSNLIYIRRIKNGFSTTHPLHPREVLLLKKWLDLRSNYNKCQNEWLFLSNSGNKISRQNFYNSLVKYGKLAGLSIKAHPHMLRHACGFELADQGLDTRLIQDYLGHKNIRHTVHYTASNAARFSNIWQFSPHYKTDNEFKKTSFLAW